MNMQTFSDNIGIRADLLFCLTSQFESPSDARQWLVSKRPRFVNEAFFDWLLVKYATDCEDKMGLVNLSFVLNRDGQDKNFIWNFCVECIKYYAGEKSFFDLYIERKDLLGDNLKKHFLRTCYQTANSLNPSDSSS